MVGWREGKLYLHCCFIKTKDLLALTNCSILHCVKIVCIRSFSGLYFPEFGLNSEIHYVSARIRSKCWKIRTRKTPNTATCLFPRRGRSLLKYGHKQTTLNIPRQDDD